MNNFTHLVVNGELPDISYRTESPEETIHPRVVEKLGIQHVYCRKKPLPIERFLHLLANEDPGLRVAGYRKAKGTKTQTSISFAKVDRVTISPRLRSLLEAMRLGDPVSQDLKAESEPEQPKVDGRTSIPKTPVTLAELEERLRKQAETGARGELVALDYESMRLVSLGCTCPGDHIKLMSIDDVAAGFDLKSEFNGQVRCIEVKASTSRSNTFFLSENEHRKLTSLADDAYIYLVRIDEGDGRRSQVIREIRNPFGSDKLVTLEPTAWMATVEDQ